MRSDRSASTLSAGPARAITMGLMTALAAWALCARVLTQERPPRFELDTFWAKIPERWVVGAVGGLCIDEQDFLLVANRHAAPAEAASSIQAPGVLEFNQQGEVINSWADSAEFGNSPSDCRIDANGDVWFIAPGAGGVRKVSHDGSKVLLQVGRAGTFDSSDGTDGGTPLNSAAPQFFGPSGLDIDPLNGDVYVADGGAARGNRRVAVLDRAGRFLRQWTLNSAEGEKSVPARLQCIRLANDGLVYVCRDGGHGIQVFDKTGRFKRNIELPTRTYSTTDGKHRASVAPSPVGIAFSADAHQRHMYVVDEFGMNVQVVDRRMGTALTSFGRGMGSFPGQFRRPHGIAVDSKGNVYVGEVEGQRFQRFKPLEP